MTVEPIIGDIFQSTCQTWVNTVNCVGVMGKGVALEFRRRFPEMYQDYLARCERKEVRLGRPYLFKQLVPPWILNFPTKDHWRGMSRISDIVEGLEYLKAHCADWGITSLAVPPLGSGQGQLDWTVVGPVLYQHLSELDIPIELYGPHGSSDYEVSREFLSRRVSESAASVKLAPGMVALVEILDRMESEPYRWPVGRIMFQKMAYFATQEGIDTGLEFSRSSFGPYAKDLKLGITRLANNGLIHERQLGRMFEVQVGPTYESAKSTFDSALRRYDVAINRVVDLFLRMNTTQAELAATVHFASGDLKKRLKRSPTEQEVLDDVMQWKRNRKPPLDLSSVAGTIRHMAALSWIDVTATSNLDVVDELELGSAGLTR